MGGRAARVRGLVTPLTPNDYDFALPPEQIAQVPADSRRSARLLVVRGDAIEHRHVHDLAAVIGACEPTPLVVVNDSRVVPARVFAERESAQALRAADRRSGPARARRAGPSLGPRGQEARGWGAAEPGRDRRDPALPRPAEPQRRARQPGLRVRARRRRAARRARGCGRAAVAALHRPAERALARRRRALPDRVRPRPGLGRGADGRPPLRRRPARPARARGDHAARRTRHLPTDGGRRRARSPGRVGAVLDPARGRRADRGGPGSGAADPRGRHHRDPNPRVSRGRPRGPDRRGQRLDRSWSSPPPIGSRWSTC